MSEFSGGTEENHVKASVRIADISVEIRTKYKSEAPAYRFNQHPRFVIVIIMLGQTAQHA
jgi:hypothetical protein